jgi:hypothetical protein
VRSFPLPERFGGTALADAVLFAGTVTGRPQRSEGAAEADKDIFSFITSCFLHKIHPLNNFASSGKEKACHS